MDIISTKGVAEVLGVSEATVKRWADAGTLRCFKTPGGHRKFRLRDVKAFLADHPDGVDAEGDARPKALTPAAPSGSLSAEQAEAQALALGGDVDALVSLAASQKLRGFSLAHTFDQVIAPAMNDIGDGWASGRLSSAQEHIASNAVKDMIARVRPLVERTSRTERGTALCACLGDEHHDIGVRMAALVLASEGFRTAVVGANVPVGDLALMVAGNPPTILAVSAARSAPAERLRGDLAILASTAAASRTRIIVGGAGFDKLDSLPNGVVRSRDLATLVAWTQENE
ncbi:MAG: helix-turn-helix domain-containing protein [Polyangiaceae bacterium]